jgi:tyrosinase
MQQHALEIAKTYSDSSWLTAAQNLRAPYWDWATNIVPPAEVISLESVEIITADGNTTPVPNPLFQYTFNPIDPSFPSPYSSWQTTIRHPDDPNSPNASTDIQALVQFLSSSQNDITSSIYNVLTRVQTWPAFSNHTAGDGGSSSNSLEAVHDEIHVLVAGDMGDPAVAGFDPIFFLHHANVDRMLSLWEAINPGVWVTKGPAEGGTWAISGNATVGPSTNLEPFWRTQKTYWESANITATSHLQYSYPEFNGLNLSNPNTVRDAIGNYINQQYGGGGGSSFSQALFAQPPAAQEPVAVAASTAADSAHPFHSRGGPQHPVHKPAPGKGVPNAVHDWTARIHFKKYELGGSFAVLIFLGDVPADAKQWRTCPSYIGSHSAFVNSAASQCSNCRSQENTIVEGFVHLNSGIAKYSGLNSYEPEKVTPYLKQNLHWRIQAADRSAVEPAKLPSCEVTIVSNVLTQPTGALFPIAGDPTYHHHITYGRPGGARQAQA